MESSDRGTAPRLCAHGWPEQCRHAVCAHLAGHCHWLWLPCLLCLAWRAFFARRGAAGIAGQPHSVCMCYSNQRYALGRLSLLDGNLQVNM